jgi:hypothetical protein
LGDASTKFFQAKATTKFKEKICYHFGRLRWPNYNAHQANADLIWSSFNERLGDSHHLITFNLSNLIQNAQELSSLVDPFFKEEIDLVVKHLPSDKARGSDGFNTDFIKKCRLIICNDFLQPLLGLLQ